MILTLILSFFGCKGKNELKKEKSKIELLIENSGNEYRNRKIYKKLTVNILKKIPNHKLEQTILDNIDTKFKKGEQYTLEKISKLTKGQQAVFSTFWLEGEVYNGGFNQYYFNPSGKFSKMTPKQIDEIINKIGGPEGLRNLFVKLKTGSEDFFKTLQAFDNSSFDLTKALKNAQGDITVLGGIVRNRWNVVLAKLGETILPLVAQVFDGLNNILTWTYANFENIKMVVIALAAGASVFVANFLLVKTIMIASSIASVGLSGSLGLVVGALRAVGLAIYSIPIIGWIAAAIGAIVLMYQKFDWFRDLIDTIGSTFKDFFKELWTRTKAVVGGIVDMFVGLARIIGGALTFDKEMISSGVDKFKKGLETQKVEVGMVAKNLNPVDYAKQGFDTYHKKQDARRHSEKIKAIAEEKAKEEAEGTTNDPLNTNNTPVGDDITTVTGAGSSVKNITYNIEAFNKGGINTSNTILNKMSAEEIEQWFTEAMLRLSRTIELGQ